MGRPLTSPRFAAQERIAWLLRTNRKGARDLDLRSARRFAKVFAPELNPSQVSRWESGISGVGAGVLRRYEEVLGLPAASLRHIRDAVLRWVDPRPMPAELATDVDVHQLLHQVRGVDPLGDDTWLAFSELVRSRPGLVLHPGELWDGIAHRLLTEMVSAEGGAWLVRQEAVSRMLEHPDAAARTIGSCIAVAEDPGIPSYIEPISLLEVTADPVASAFIIGQLRDPLNPRARQAALQTVLRKARAGHFREPYDQSPLVRTVREFLADDDSDLGDVPMVVNLVRLAARWGVPITPRWIRRLADDPVARSVWSDGQTLSVAQTGPLGSRLALAAQSVLDLDVSADDPMLSRLLQEMLFAADSDTRLYAALMIAATPYRRPVAEALVAELPGARRRRFDSMPATALRAITLLGEAGHRSVLVDLLANPHLSRSGRLAAARAAAHCSGDQAVDDWRRAFAVQRSAWLRARDDAETDVLDAITAAMGTAGHSTLLLEIAADTVLPNRTRLTAAWWLANQSE